MGKVKFWFFILVVLILALSGVNETYAKFTENGIRYWSGPDHTRLVIAVSDSCDVDWVMKDDPPRIEIKLAKPVKDWNEPFIFVEDKFIEHVAYIQSEKYYTVIVFLRKRKNPNIKVFTLKKDEDRPFRVVVDLSPSLEEEMEIEKSRVMDAERIRRDKKYIVVVDPGHGGNDPGAIGVNGLMEKDVVLDIAKKVNSICGNHTYFKVVLTRDSDYFIPLEKRVKIARDYRADLFVSIHANSAPNRNYDGFMAFVLAPRGAKGGIERLIQDAENKEVAGELKNGHDYTAKVLLDFSYEYTMVEGRRLAKFILDEVDEYTNFTNRGIKEAAFYVLRNPGVPAILLEVGFLSNERDARKLADDEERRKVAMAICEGIKRYFEHVESMKNLTAKVIDRNYSNRSKRASITKRNDQKADAASQNFTTSSDYKASSERVSSTKVYEVKKGDTLFSIARLFNVSVEDIIRLNNIKKHVVYPGMKLFIPVR